MGRKVSKKQIVFIVRFSAVLAVTGFVIINSQDYVKSDIFVLISFAINMMISYLNLINSVKNHPFSFDVMFWLFNLFFFCIAPCLQYLTGKYAWYLHPTDTEVLKTNLLLTIWLVFYLIGRIAGNKRIVLRRRKVDLINYDYKFIYIINRSALNILLLISVLIVFYYLTNIGFVGMIIRSTNTIAEIESKTIGLLINHGFHNILLFVAVLHILDAKTKRIRLMNIIAILCFVIGCFPTGIARNMMASFYAGMMIITFNSARETRWMTWAIFAGLLLVFPAINLFRHLNVFQNISVSEYIFTSFGNTYLTGDYDAHQMFISIQRWVQKDGLSWGNQLLGAILFFIPRTLWPDKALGTGQTAFTVTQQHWYTNVSAPLPSEGYVNFGIPGIILFALITGYLTYRVDIVYWNSENPLSLIRIIYPFSMFMFFFVCRGDLQSTGSYFLAQIIIGTVIYLIAVRKKKEA